MTASAQSSKHEYVLRAIDAHFAGRISVANEKAMRAHLPTCASCMEEYERHLIVAGLDPRAISAEERIGSALGLRKRLLPVWARRAVGIALPVAAAASFALLAVGGIRALRPEEQPDGFRARCIACPSAFSARSAATNASPQKLWVYRTYGISKPILADGEMRADEALAFAYSNPAGKPYLMIFGIDDRDHVYWFHPGWPRGKLAPESAPASVGPGPHELSFETKHVLHGNRLAIFALFSDHPFTTTTVEAHLEASKGSSVLSFGSGTFLTRRTLEVRR